MQYTALHCVPHTASAWHCNSLAASIHSRVRTAHFVRLGQVSQSLRLRQPGNQLHKPAQRSHKGYSSTTRVVRIYYTALRSYRPWSLCTPASPQGCFLGCRDQLLCCKAQALGSTACTGTAAIPTYPTVKSQGTPPSTGAPK
jgi:hypothetical protein